MTYKNIAIKAAKIGGEILRRNFRKIKKVNYKNNRQNIVTMLDLASEKAMIKTIQDVFPLHAILSEESKQIKNANAQYMWIIDPLDGTANYVSGNSYFSVSVALQHKGETILGVTYSPIIGELFVAEKGKGTICNGKKIKVSKTKSLEDAIICVDWNHCQGKDREKIRDILYKLGEKARRVLSYGSGVLGASYVANGIFDAYFNISSHPWDHVAASLIVKNAGGKAATVSGEKQKGLTNSIVASNGKIHKYLLDLLN